MNDSKRYLKKIRAILPVWGSYEKRFKCHGILYGTSGLYLF